MALTTNFIEYNVKAFGVTLDDAAGFGRYVEIAFNGPNDPDVLRLHVGQTARFLRGTRSKVWVRASAAGNYEVTWQIDRFARKEY
jgi:adenylate cyclase class IV